MTYQLGVDLGTTRTAAAVWRDGVATIVTLGARSATMPSVVYAAADGTILVGEAALRRGASDPTRLAREFKRRFGDPEPLLLGGVPWSPAALTARLLGAVVELVTEREGGPPACVVLTHPANWGPFKTDLLAEAARMCDLGGVELLTEPAAAARHYASNARVAAGATVAVYDLGGGTFDAAVLRKGADGFETIGRPEGLERFGGIDVDAAVLGHVHQVLGDALGALDPSDPLAVTAMARLRHECVEAKEALSADVETSISVVVPGLATEVRLTRAELEAMVAPVLGDTVAALRRALGSAGVEPGDLAAVLLVGGASRMPLVARLVTEELGRPVAVDADPKHAIALGAALAAAVDPAAGAAVSDAALPAGASTATEPVVTPAVAAAVEPEPRPAPAAAAPGPQRRRGKRAVLVGGLGGAAVVTAVVMAVGGGGGAGGLAAPASGVTGEDTPAVVESANTAPEEEDEATGAPRVVFDSVERGPVNGVIVTYRIEGEPPESTPTPLHADFFYDDQHPESIGIDTYATYGRYGGLYYIDPDDSPFVMPDIDGIDDEQLCALVADAEDRVLDPGALVCVDVPARAP